ncbi:type IV secretion system protein TraC [Aquella oligotrophica]|uniref:Type IV secretion system protein TraC n=1 Tax=Aquella oligotrophica TaxID=2067065 RepID=A0A2I7N6J2_9NEIS|nr:type IV secretion system protein TraC [Aquella oligotrophica]AUR52097.1 type IV secretion system protein TraC [Aquella oligotrophica]
MNLEQTRKLYTKRYNDVVSSLKQCTKKRQQSPKDNITEDYKCLNTPHNIGKFLNYDSYIKKLGVFQNDNSYGFALYTSPLTGGSETLANQLMGLFALRFPMSATLSFCLYGCKELKNKFDIWLGRRKNAQNQVCAEIAKRRVDHYLKGINKTLIEGEKLLIRDYRMIVSVTFDGKIDDYGRREIEIFKKSFISTLNNSGMATKEMDPDMLLDFCDEIFNRQSGLKNTNYKHNPFTPLKRQVSGPDTRILVDKDGMSFNNTVVRGLTVKDYPTQASLAQAMDLIGDIVNDNAQISSQFMYCTNIWFPNISALKNQITAKSARAIQNASSPMAKWVPDFHAKAEDWRKVTEILADGQGLCYFNQMFFSFSELGTSNYAERDMVDLFRSKGWTVAPASFINYPTFLSCMPMQFDNEMFIVNKAFKLNRLLPQWNIINLVPMIGEWSGNSYDGGGMMLLGRRGQLMNLDIFRSEGNYNVAIAADSGAGKSFFMNDLIISYLGIGAKIFMIDVGRSYLKLCEVLSGQFISFGKEQRNVCLNPFSYIMGDAEEVNDDLKMIRDVLCLAINPGGLNNLEVTYIGMIVNRVWIEKNRHACFDDIYHALLEHDEVLVRNLGIQLQPYSKDGIYSRYFNGEANINFNNQFVVLELEELNMKPDLRNVIFSILMQRISQEMYLGNKNQLKICGIDEAWDLFRGGSRTQEFIETGYRRARKYNGAFITITQRIQDYYANEGATACLTNSDWQFMLKQKEESIDQLRGDKKLSLSEWQMELIKTVKTRKGIYSDIFIKANGIGTPVRLITDKYSNLIYTTDPKDFQLVEDFKASGYAIHEAISKVLEYKEQLQQVAS